MVGAGRVAEHERIAVLVEELGHSRNTIAKVLTQSGPPGYRRKNPPPRPALDPFLPNIDTWVEAAREQSYKQLHTDTRIYEQLRNEYGFTGSISAVRRYLVHRKQTQG